MEKNIFKNLILLARPAGGKSEFIDFMKNTPEAERAKTYHIGPFEEVDDFRYIFEHYNADNEREAKGERRQFTTKAIDGINLLNPKLRRTFIPRLNEEIIKRQLENGTLLIEFARGIGDGFWDSLTQFKPEILKDTAILYVDVSFEESWRKNNDRYKKGAEGTSLFHKVPDKDMIEYFKENDWKEITKGEKSGYLKINGTNVPFVTMNNEPELKERKALEERYGSALNKLIGLYQNR